MANIRTIKREMLDDVRVASLPHDAFRLFIGAILLADDYGVLRADDAYLDGHVFSGSGRRRKVAVIAADLERFDPALDQSHGVWITYSIRGQRYAYLCGWGKHQRIDKRATPRLPWPTDPVAKDFKGIDQRFRDGPGFVEFFRSGRRTLEDGRGNMEDGKGEGSGRGAPPALPPPDRPVVTDDWNTSVFQRLWDAEPGFVAHANSDGFHELEACTVLIRQQAAKAERSAAELAGELFKAFIDRIAAWQAAGQPAPEPSPAKFREHFAKVCSWAAGNRYQPKPKPEGRLSNGGPVNGSTGAAEARAAEEATIRMMREKGIDLTALGKKPS